MTLNDIMALILHYFSEIMYAVVVKQLLGLHRFQNLLLILYNHFETDLRNYSAIIWANRSDNWV